MPCDTQRLPDQTPEQRMLEIAESINRLERQLAGGNVRVAIGPQGAIAFVGWSKSDRARVSDVCAYRKLESRGSWALLQAVKRAETLQGRKVNAQAVAAGVHSHDGGQTWSPGH